MSATLVLSIVLVLLLGVVAFGIVVLLVGAVLMMVRARRSASAPSEAAPLPPPPQTLPPEPPKRPAGSVPPASPPHQPAAPPPALGAGLIGFFDDEPSTARTGEVEGAKTELFQRGKMAIDWDDDEDEGEATEIFSAHGAAGDLAEFAFDDDDASTGRFSD